MADGFIVRKGGVADATPPPTIKFVSKTEDSVTFTITNNSLKARDITYGLNTPPTTTTINLAGEATSLNQTISNITEAFVTIFAQAEDSAITEFRVRLEFRNYTAATGGTTLEYDSGGKRFRSHTFTSNGNFVVSTVGDNIDDRNKVDYLIIAGGGSGGNNRGAGGGAGGYRSTISPTPNNVTPNAKVTVTAATFAVTIGGGGAAQTTFNTAGNNGTNSSVAFANTITATAGGRGASNGTSQTAGNGGSGGGGGLIFNTTPGTGTSGQGFAGGLGGNFSGSNNDGGGGGGGASQLGGDTISTIAGKGGDGLANTLRDGTSETRGGGGGGGSNSTVAAGVGGAGGGGAGGNSANGTSGTATTGGGSGGGGIDVQSGTGGSGIVVIRYEIALSV